ncbi:MAG: Fe-Mn family superoxide dismutase [Patescibacteria group bacterium]
MFEAKNYDRLLGTAGFSDEMLKNHFTLYQGYVTNSNTLHTTMHEMLEAGTMAKPEYSEIKRRFGWEFNGMRMHELYFDNMTNEKKDASALWESPMVKKMTEQFGGPDKWKEIFVNVGKMRGIGWAVLCMDPVSKHLFNVWINEHDVGHLATCTPILVMDVFEHAFMIDYGLKRADYIESFWNAIDWQVMSDRFDAVR